MAKTKQSTEWALPEDLRDSAHKIWLAGLGALATAEEEGGKIFKKLVEKGEGMEARGKDVVENAKAKVGNVWEEVETKIDEKVTAALHRLGVPSRDEISKLTKKVEDLSKKIEALTAAKASHKAAA
ncbi:MAG TPA: phasin family protein [Thermoanaerobaculia bacterium]|nr:phasin family protein [Thermoanaerobaculia bacterium]